MKPALIAALIFFAALTPGLLKHGQPLPQSGRNVLQPVAAASSPADTAAAKPAPGKPTLLALLARWAEG